jgi:uncharacterized protein
MGVADDVVLIDHHCHSVNVADLTLVELGRYLTESPLVDDSGVHLDAPLGLAVRRWCPPLLDLEPFCTWDDYIARRLELGGVEATRRLLRSMNASDLLIDTGYRATELVDFAGLAELSGARIHEVLRIETISEEILAELLAAGSVELDDFMVAFEHQLSTADIVGLKSVLAYRCGFDADLTVPSWTVASVAFDAWVERTRHGDARLADSIMLSLLINRAAEIGAERSLPLQFHVGLGDPDVELHRSNPSYLADFIARHRDTTIALLHCWPFEREAGYLAAAYPNVRFDVGLSLNYVGPAAPTVMARALELAPFGSQLYASDTFGVAELYAAGAAQYRWALNTVMDRWIADGSCSLAECERIAAAISSGNARSVYARLD